MQVRSRVRCDSVAVVVRSTHLPVGLIIRSADDADWPAMARLAAVCFGSFRSPVAADGAIVVCDGPEIVGVALYLDLGLTVPGGPAAGVSWVAVASTHRRRGL